MHTLWNRIVTVRHPDEDVQRRGQTMNAVTLMLILLALIPLGLSLFVNLSPSGVLIALGIISVLGGVIALARRGFVVVGAAVLMVLLMLVPMFGVLSDRVITHEPIFCLLAPLVASVILSHRQIWLVSLLSALLLAGAAMTLGISLTDYDEGGNLVRSTLLMIGVTTLIGTISARNVSASLLVARQASTGLAEAAQRLEQANADLERRVTERTASLETALRVVEEREARLMQTLGENEQQRQVIREMSMPIIPISQSTLIMPLVGALDSSRLLMLQEQALAAIERNGARTLVLDITGVPVVDTHVARGLIAVVEAARLLGAEVVLVGIRPEVAQAIVGLGLSFTTLPTFSDLQSALRQGRLLSAG